MRKEAALEQWRTLYEAATRIGELKPWEKFWDMDLLAIRNGAEEDTVFFSILGHGGSCYGIAVYEGYEGLNSFMMLALQEKMNLTPEYAMFNQKNLTCYWGSREELTEKQRKTIKDLGYKYRGKNQWLYFQSFEPGYYPYNFDEAEVLRMSEHLQNLELVLRYYEEADVNVDFENGNMLLFTPGKAKETWNFEEAPLPFMAFQFGTLEITEEELLSDLANAPKSQAVLEADICIMGTAVKDKKYDRPAHPMISMLGDAASGMIIHFKMSEPEENPVVNLARELVDVVLKFGAPKEIYISNAIVEAGLEQVCEVCGIKLRRAKRLKGLEDFRQGLGRFM